MSSDQSPIIEAQADSLDELFAVSPLELTDEELSRMIDQLREFRTQVETKRKIKTERQQSLEVLALDDEVLDILEQEAGRKTR